MKSPFLPDAYAPRVTFLAPADLFARGYRGAIVDLDNTLVGYHTRTLADEDAAWVRAVAAAGIRIVVVTNNGTPWAAQVAREMGVPCVARARKPLPYGFRRALDLLALERRHVVVIGDQLFTDVLGARWAGLDVILVDPLVRRDPWNTRPLRWLERALLRKVPRV
ncbi:MAG TPA: YqeG family HAD IIIA-type phosphatase [Candidatus Sulfotelmatobacter sp.]|nr:YqeG family HAD IIIA-type phosphatase [Candidatus Sulfotelmatobacter sp.]